MSVFSRILIAASAVLMLFFTISCSSDESFTTSQSAVLTFSEDTVNFDTIFTTFGSSTQNIRVFNNNKDGVRIQNIRLASNGESGFRVNVDGVMGTSFSDLELKGNDSVYVFVEVTIPETKSDTPVQIKDSLLFTLESGVQQKVLLIASGQDAIVYKSLVINNDSTFSSTKPYIIYDSLTVAEGAKLTLMPGTKLYFHSGAGLKVKGTLESIGTVENPVVMRGDRTDNLLSYLPYDRVNSQWDGVELYSTSKNNLIDHTDIHSGTFGIKCDSTGFADDKLILTNSVIHNVTGHGLQSTCNKIGVSNTQISNCGGDCVNLNGGDYTFIHCTIAQFYPWDADRGAALRFAATENHPLQKCDFINSIITGIGKDELYGTPPIKKEIPFVYSFVRCLLHTPEVLDDNQFLDNIWDNEPKSNNKGEDSLIPKNEDDEYVIQDKNFKLIDHENFIYNFELDSLSPARGKALAEAAKRFPTDRNGVSRLTNPDIGCYQSTYSK